MLQVSHGFLTATPDTFLATARVNTVQNFVYFLLVGNRPTFTLATSTTLETTMAKHGCFTIAGESDHTTRIFSPIPGSAAANAMQGRYPTHASLFSLPTPKMSIFAKS